MSDSKEETKGESPQEKNSEGKAKPNKPLRPQRPKKQSDEFGIQSGKISKEDPGQRNNRLRDERRKKRRRSMSQIHISSSFLEEIQKKREQPSEDVTRVSLLGGLPANSTSPVGNLSDGDLSDFRSTHDSEFTGTSDTDGEEEELTYLEIIRGETDFDFYEMQEEKHSKAKSVFPMPDNYIELLKFPRNYNFATGGRCRLDVNDEVEVDGVKSVDGVIIGSTKKKKTPKKKAQKEKDDSKEQQRKLEAELDLKERSNPLYNELEDFFTKEWNAIERNYEVGGGREEIKTGFLKVFKTKKIPITSDKLKPLNIKHIRCVDPKHKSSRILQLNSSRRTIEREAPFSSAVEHIVEHRVLVSFRQLYFSVGRFEPLFCKGCLYNYRTKEKLTNDFHFHFNSRDMLEFVDDANDPIHSFRKFVKDSAKSVMGVEERDPDVILVLVVCSIFGSDTKPYAQPKKYKSFEELIKKTESIAYLSHFWQPIAVGYTRIYRKRTVKKDGSVGSSFFSTLTNLGNKVVSSNKKKKQTRKRYATLSKSDVISIMKMQGMTEKEIERELRKEDKDKRTQSHGSMSVDDDDGDDEETKKERMKREREEKAKEERERMKIRKEREKTLHHKRMATLATTGIHTLTKDSEDQLEDGSGEMLVEELVLKEGICEMNLFHIPPHEKHISVIDYLKKRDKSQNKFDGKAYIEISDASIFEYYGKDYFKNLEERRISKIQQYCDWDKLIEEQFHNNAMIHPRRPLVHFSNTLYCFPLEYSPGMKLLGSKKQNICLKLTYRGCDTIEESPMKMPPKGKKAFLPRYWINDENEIPLEENLISKYFTEIVTFGDKKRVLDFFTDEIKVCLPSHIGKKDHILVTVYNVFQKMIDLKSKQQGDGLLFNDYTGPVKKQVVGFGFVKVDDVLRVENSSQDNTCEVEVILHKNLVDGYLEEKNKELKKAGGKKVILQFRNCSFLHPSNKVLEQFYQMLRVLFRKDSSYEDIGKSCDSLINNIIPSMMEAEMGTFTTEIFVLLQLIFYSFCHLFHKRSDVIKKKGRGYGDVMTSINNLIEELFRLVHHLYLNYTYLCHLYAQYLFQVPKAPSFEEDNQNSTEKKQPSAATLPKDIDLSKLPKGIDLSKLPKGIDLSKLPKGLPKGLASPPEGMGALGGGTVENSYLFILCSIWITMMMGGAGRKKSRAPRTNRKKGSLTQVFFNKKASEEEEKTLCDISIETSGFLFDMLSKLILVEKEEIFKNDKIISILEKLIKMYIDKIFIPFIQFKKLQQELQSKEDVVEESEEKQENPNDQNHSGENPNPLNGIANEENENSRSSFSIEESGEDGKNMNGSCGGECGKMRVESVNDLNERLGYFLTDLFNNGLSSLNLLPLRILHYYYLKVTEPLHHRIGQSSTIVYRKQSIVREVEKGAEDLSDIDEHEDLNRILNESEKNRNSGKEAEKTKARKMDKKKFRVLDRHLKKCAEQHLKLQLEFYRIFVHHPCFLNFCHPLPYESKIHCCLDMFINTVIYAVVNKGNRLSYDTIVNPYVELFYEHLLEMDMDPKKQKAEQRHCIGGCYFPFFTKLIQMNYIYTTNHMDDDDDDDEDEDDDENSMDPTERIHSGSANLKKILSLRGDGEKSRSGSILMRKKGSSARVGSKMVGPKPRTSSASLSLFASSAESGERIISILNHLKGFERIKLCCIFLFILENLERSYFKNWVKEMSETQPPTVMHLMKFLLYMLKTFVSLDRPRMIYFSQLVMDIYREVLDLILPKLLEEEEYSDVISEILRFSFYLFETKNRQCNQNVFLYYLQNVVKFTLERLSSKLSLDPTDENWQKCLYYLMNVSKFPLKTQTCLIVRDCLDLLMCHHERSIEDMKKSGIKRKQVFKEENPYFFLQYQCEEEKEGENVIFNSENDPAFENGSIKGCSLSKLIEYICFDKISTLDFTVRSSKNKKDESEKPKRVNSMDLLDEESNEAKRMPEKKERKKAKTKLSKNVILLTHKSFISSIDLMNAFFSFYDFICAKEDELPGRKDERLKKIVDTIQYWMKNYFFTFDNLSLVFMISSFFNRNVKGIMKEHRDSLVKKFHKALFDHLSMRQGGSDAKTDYMSTEIQSSTGNNRYEYYDKKFFLKSKIPPKYRKKLDKLIKEVSAFKRWKQVHEFIFSWDAREIAQQMCLIEFDMYQKITPKEFFKKLGDSPNIDQLTQRFNGVTEWVTNAIIEHEDPKKRKEVAEKFIMIMQHLGKLHNFHGVNEIVSILNSPVIERLINPEMVPKGWRKISEKNWKMVQNCIDIMSSDNGYRRLRNELSVRSMAIPFLGMYQTDLVKIEVGNPDYYEHGIEKTVNEETMRVVNKLINLNKRLLISNTLKPILFFQKKNYNFKIRKINCLYNALKDIANMTDYLPRKEIYALSIKYKKKK